MAELMRVISRATELVEAGWVQGAYATDGYKPVEVNDLDASHFDARGAILRAGIEVGASSDQLDEAFDLVEAAAGSRTLAAWNDTATKSDVVAAMREATQHALQRQRQLFGGAV